MLQQDKKSIQLRGEGPVFVASVLHCRAGGSAHTVHRVCGVGGRGWEGLMHCTKGFATPGIIAPGYNYLIRWFADFLWPQK